MPSARIDRNSARSRPGRRRGYGPCAPCGTLCASVAASFNSRFLRSRVSRGVAARAAALAFSQFLVLRHRVVLHDLALEDPDLHAAGSVSRERGGHAVIDVGAQRMQRHAALAIPLHPRDLGAAEPPRAIDADALGAKPHGRLHGPLHGAAEGDAPFELLGDRLGDELGVELRLTDFNDIDDDVRVGQRRHHAAQLLDIGALLADHHAWPRRVNGNAAFLVRALDDDLGYRGLLEQLLQLLANLHILVQQPAVFALAGKPARIPGAVHTEPQSNRIDLLTHVSSFPPYASTSRTTMVRLEKGFIIPAARPRPRAWKRFITRALPTCASATTRSSTSRS